MQRTKNRIREHSRPGHIFVEKKRGRNHSLGCDSILFQCSCGWFGWLPIGEILIVKPELVNNAD